MLQAKIVAPRKIELGEVEIPGPRENEVLIKVHYNAICGSEFPAYLGIAIRYPHYLRIVEFSVERPWNLEMVKSGSIYADRLISHGVPLQEINRSFEIAANRQALLNCFYLTGQG